MRKACGLSLRARHLETNEGGLGLLHVPESQEERDFEDSQYQSLYDDIFTHLMQLCLSDVTLFEFKQTNTFYHVRRAAKRVSQKGCRKGKVKDVIQPILTCSKKMEEVIACRKADTSATLAETMDVVQMRKYLDSNDSRANNIETFKLFLQS